MNLARIDLNLLRVFDAIFEDRNLLLAGKRLNLSQSAISHALGRLRDVLEDDLFVRTAKGMQPTARAEAMAMPLRNALQQIQNALGNEPFLPKVASRDFVVAANDYMTMLLLSRLSRRLSAEAPMVNLIIRPSTRLDLAEQIDLGRIDIAIGIFAEVPSRFQSMLVWKHTELLAMRQDHPLTARTITPEDLLNYPLATVSLGGREEGALGGFILERGLARQSEMFDRQALEDAFEHSPTHPRMRISVAHSLAIPSLLRDSDMLAIVPSPLGFEFERSGELCTRPVPYPAPDSCVRAAWHARNDQDPALQWLRTQIADVAGQVRC
ncbi:LysR family transcriptional regulator [Paraburkholderia flava]|uniref:LysR family transcriptional regulator n=1 Tax=Paraburkholderia flava TaxID=2547393 RepID=UPI00105B2406|nr:LysR family transcriptional regulator [Paraburkholderia flava]